MSSFTLTADLRPACIAGAGSPPRSPGRRAAPPLAGCDAILGLNASHPNTVVWRHDTGLFAYAADDVVVIEDLGSHKQRYLQHHAQPVRGLILNVAAQWSFA